MSAETPRSSRGPVVALVLAVCALLSCWNPFAAPVGLLLGVAVALAAWRMLVSKRGSRPVAIWALALGVSAATASVAILLLSAGALSTTLPGQATVPVRAPSDVQRMLDEAQQRTAAARGRATSELEQASPTKPGGSGTKDPVEKSHPDGQKPVTETE